MSIRIYREQQVTRPEPSPVTSTLLDHATVVDMQSFGLRNNAGLWPSFNCMDTLVPTELCPDPLDPGDTVEPKTFASAPWVPAFEFAVYGGVQCGALGLNTADLETEVRRVFARNEGKGVERALLFNRFVEGPDDAAGDPIWDAPRDVTAGLTVPAHIALALLEGDAVQFYAGLPTIHMARAMATVLAASGLIVWNGDKAFTKNGSKVAIGGGYDVNLEEGTWDMYATGEVYVERSETVKVSAYTIPGDGSSDRGLTDNTVISLVERLYRVGVDCYVAKATGKVF